MGSNCPRCHGLLFKQTDWNGEDGGKITMWHCLLCGFYTDHACEVNRAMGRSPYKGNGVILPEYPQTIKVRGKGQAQLPALEE